MYEEAIRRFNEWYVEPINKLKELPAGNGGFAAFIVALALYERLIAARLKLRNQPDDDTNLIKREMAADLHITLGQQHVFWRVFRIGLLHGAMPEIGKTQYWLDERFSEYPEFGTLDGVPFICINTWKFADRVLQEFLADPTLITASNSFPLASVLPMPIERLILSKPEGDNGI